MMTIWFPTVSPLAAWLMIALMTASLGSFIVLFWQFSNFFRDLDRAMDEITKDTE